MHGEHAAAVCARHGVRVEGERVFMTERDVTRALRAAPAGFTLAGRSGRDLTFGAGVPVLASASGSAYVLDGATRRPGTLADMRAAVKLGHASANIDFLGISCEALDEPQEARTRRTAHALATLSDKAGEAWAALPADVDVIERVHEILYGADWHRLPRALAIINSSSPLMFSAEAGEALVRLARLGQPLCVTACVMAGTTGPATLAGTLVVQHAEVLAGLVLVQLAHEGCPFIYGGTSSVSSMRTGALFVGVPEFSALTRATAQLARFCGLPVRAGGALTDAHVPDAQAGIESAISLSTTVHAGVDFVLHAAGSLSSFNVFSTEKFALDDEVLSMLRVVDAAPQTDADALATEVIAAVGPGGSFLLAEHTRPGERSRRQGPGHRDRHVHGHGRCRFRVHGNCDDNGEPEHFRGRLCQPQSLPVAAPYGEHREQ